MKLNLSPEEITRAIFDGAVVAWSERDLDGTLALMHDDVAHTVNVNGELVPFAASVVGRAQMRDKLMLMLDTFEFDAYVTDRLFIEGNCARARMKIIYLHRGTGERLMTTYRLKMVLRDGLIAKIETHHDASYLEAFMRFVNTTDAK